MRFTGQVKIPDLDYPGVPASVQLDGEQVELFVDGESVGRWSLVDVRAERLVSSAFSLKLAGEEVTFIADQPTEFAYGGVEAMANVWALHRTMRFPRRMVADRRSRKGTKPSRIPDLREAIEETLAGTTPTALVSGRPPTRKPASGIASLRETPVRRANDVENGAPSEAASQADDLGEEAASMREAGDTEPLVFKAEDEAPATSARPDSDAIPDQHDPVPDSPDTPDAVLAEPETERVAPPPTTDSVFKQSVPWAKNKDNETEGSLDSETSFDSETLAPSPAEAEIQEQAVAESPGPDEGSPVPGDIEDAPQSAVAHPGSAPWLAPQVSDDPPEAAETPPEPAPGEADEEALLTEPEHVVDLSVSEDDGRGDDERDGDDHGAEEHLATLAETDDEEASLPMATAAARGGIMGAVRSAFVRNRAEHTHVYVEAPGGIGIKRQICAECGHISIGVE